MAFTVSPLLTEIPPQWAQLSAFLQFVSLALFRERQRAIPISRERRGQLSGKSR